MWKLELFDLQTNLKFTLFEIDKAKNPICKDIICKFIRYL